MNAIPDGLTQIEKEIPLIMGMIAQSARWVHPDTFKALPVWRPEMARKAPLYINGWREPMTNNGAPKFEGNVTAQYALMRALGVVGKNPSNWTTCHIWGYDDDKFGGKSAIVQDHRFFSCVANMVLLPTPLKGFTDAVPSIKRHLRVCAYHLYGWICEHENAEAEADRIRCDEIPDGYPLEWPTAERKILPPGTAPFSDLIKQRVVKQKRKIAKDLSDSSFQFYPREEVRRVLDFWKVEFNDIVESR
jgi:hypothetical protein